MADAKEQTLARLGDLQHEYEHLGGYEMRTRAEAALSGLGFKESEFNKPFQSFSGGCQMRAELVRTLIARPDILMLDEPSNYLDLPAVEWLQRFLRGFGGTMLLISHDRYLLETLTDRTLEINGGCAVKYTVGYTWYIKEREQRHHQQAVAWRNYQEQKEHLESFIRRFRAKATKAAQVQSRVKMLEKLKAVRRPPKPPNISNLRIAPPPRCGAQIMQLENAGFSYDHERWIFREVDLDIQNGQKIAIVGYNGMGKTTLLRLLAGTLEAGEGARREGYKVVLGYQSQDFAETMPPDKTVLGIVREANTTVPERDVRGLPGSFGFSVDAVTKPCAVLSGGEKIRLAFARIFSITDTGVASYPGGYDYYLEKTAAQETVKSPKSKVKSVSLQASGLTPQAARKLRAHEREAQQGLRKMEVEMEKLHAGQQELHEQMASGDPSIDYSKLNIQLSEVIKKLTALETCWLKEADRLGRD